MGFQYIYKYFKDIDKDNYYYIKHGFKSGRLKYKETYDSGEPKNYVVSNFFDIDEIRSIEYIDFSIEDLLQCIYKDIYSKIQETNTTAVGTIRFNIKITDSKDIYPITFLNLRNRNTFRYIKIKNNFKWKRSFIDMLTNSSFRMTGVIQYRFEPPGTNIGTKQYNKYILCNNFQ